MDGRAMSHSNHLKLVRDLKLIASFVAIFVAGTAFVYGYFASIRYVDSKHSEAIEHSDENTKAIMNVLLEMKRGDETFQKDVKESVKTMEGRVWEIVRTQRGQKM